RAADSVDGRWLGFRTTTVVTSLLLVPRAAEAANAVSVGSLVTLRPPYRPAQTNYRVGDETVTWDTSAPCTSASTAAPYWDSLRGPMPPIAANSASVVGFRSASAASVASVKTTYAGTCCSVA